MKIRVIFAWYDLWVGMFIDRPKRRIHLPHTHDRGGDPAMSQRESRLSRDIMKELRLKGVFCFKVHGGPTMMVGLPDIVACVRGKFYGLEVKLPGNEEGASTTQLLVQTQIKQAGGRSYIVASVQEALRVCRL